MTSAGSISIDTGDKEPDFTQPAPSETEPGRPKRWPWMILGAVVLGGIAFGVWWFELRTEAVEETTFETIQQTAEVTTGTFSTTVSAEGTVSAAETEDLSFTSAGTVTSVNVEVGDVVRAGDVLATIDSAELEASLAEAQAEYDDLDAQLADYIDDEASEEQIELAEARLAVAADQLENEEEALAGTQLVAEIDGTVTVANLTVGEELGSGGAGGVDLTGSESGSGNSSGSLGSGGTDIPGGDGTTTATSGQFTIVSVGRYAIDLSIDTTEIDAIELGQEVTITEATASTSGFPGGGGLPGGGVFPGGGGNPFGGGFNPFEGGGNPFGGEGGAEIAGNGAVATGEVTDISRIADASSGVASYTVTVEFLDEDEAFYVGTTVIAEILTGERTDVVQVPSQAITSDENGSTVTVATDGTLEGSLETRNVTTGETSGNMTEITSGVQPGEVVVIQFELPAGIQDRFSGGGEGFPEGGFPSGGEGLPEGGFPSGGEGLPEGGFPGGGQGLPDDGASDGSGG